MAASGESTAAASSRSTNVTLAAIAGLVWVITGQVLFARAEPSIVALPMWIAGLLCITGAVAVVERRHVAMRPKPVGSAAQHLPTPRTGWMSGRTLVPAGASIAACVIAWSIQQNRPDGASRWDLLGWWGLAVVGALGSVWQPQPGRTSVVLRAWWARRRRDLTVLGALTALGGVPALAGLASNPWAFNGDEGGFALVSSSMIDGSLRDPFTIGYLGHPTLYNVLQAGSMVVLGRNVFAARLVCGVLGALAVPLAFVVTSRLVGRRSSGWVAAALLATFHVHLYWTHSALPNGASTFCVLLVLALLDRALVGEGPAALMAVGVATGLAQYGYFANRLLVPVVLLAFVVAAMAPGARRSGALRRLETMAIRIALAAAGFLATTAPLIASFVRHPGQFNSRVDQVSIFAGRWLDDTAAREGVSRTSIIGRQLREAAMLPFRTPPTGFYRGDVPFTGWTMAIVGAIGLATVTFRALRPRWTAPAAAWWLSAIGMALTTGPADTNRWVLAIPLLCVFSAVGLDALLTVAAEHGAGIRRAAQVVAGTVVCAACVISLHQFFHDANQVAVYSDRNTQTAEHLARDLVRIDPDATVYFAGAPRMYYTGFNDLVFRTPHVRSVDVLEPWTTASPRPALHGVTVFVVLPERIAELDVLTTWFPNGRRQDTVDRSGNLLASLLVVPAP